VEALLVIADPQRGQFVQQAFEVERRVFTDQFEVE
jgi:hypothetical protein